MKIYKFFAALVMGLTMVACGNEVAEPVAEGDETVAKVLTKDDFVPTKAEVNTVSYLLGINFGSIIKGNDFGELSMAQMERGIKDFLAAEGSPMDPEFGDQFKVNPNNMNEIINNYLQKRRNFQAYDNKEKSEAFLAENAKKDGVQITPSGLQYKIIEPGNDVKPTADDEVSVHYKGTLIDGTVFDETMEGGEPISFPLSGVISGWTEGLQLIGEGGRVMLYIPSELGYGENGGGAVIGPNAALIFDVTLVKVVKAEAEATE